MSDFRPLGKAIQKPTVLEPERFEPVNKSGTVVVGKDGMFQTRRPLPPAAPVITTEPEQP